jgi:hypothetical protein
VSTDVLEEHIASIFRVKKISSARNQHSSPTWPPVQWVLTALSPWVKQPGHEADHSPSSGVKIKNGGAMPPLPYTSSWHGASLIKHGDNFTLPYLVCYYK